MKLLILFVCALLLNINSRVDADLDLFQEARILYSQARFSDAISVYQEIIKNNPEELEAYFNLAYLYKDLAEYDLAIGTIRRALKLFKDSRLTILLGRLYYLDGKSRQAISQLAQLSPPYSEDPQVLFYLGLCYEDIGKLAEAQAFYLDVVRLKPNNVLAYLRLGNIYYAKQMFKQARQIYQRVASLDPSAIDVHRRLAECSTKLGEFTQAYEQYAKCVAIHPEDQLLQKKLEQTKTRLGEKFFKQRERLALQRRWRKLIKVKAPSGTLSIPQVKVGICEIKGKGSVKFKCGTPFQIIDKQTGDSLFNGREESIYSLVFDKKANPGSGPHAKNFGVTASIQLKDHSDKVLLAGIDKPFLIRNKSKNSVISIFDIPTGRGNFWAGWDDQQYRGIVEVVPDNDGFWLINLVNLEEYLYGVLPSEMPANWPKQALYAQAIAARTWAVRNKSRHNHQGFNFCSTVHCQVYKGARAEMQLTNQAVDETAGLILTVDGQPVDILYSNNCGGCTQDGIIDADSLDFHFPLSPLELEEWLRGQPDTFCNLDEARLANFRWVRLYEQQELESLLVKFDIDVGKPTGIIPQKRASSGHLISIKIEGVENTKIIEGENNIRKILGNLRSSAFKIEVKYNQQNQPVEFIFYGGGFGHGRGVCQAGVKGMALRGYNYLEILKHYYPAAEIKKIY